MNLTEQKKLTILIISSILATIIFLLVVYFGVFGNKDIIKNSIFKTIVPGTTSVDELKSKTGPAATTTKEDGFDRYYYPGSKDMTYDSVFTKNGRVVATQERLDGSSLFNDFQKKYNESPISLFDQNFQDDTWHLFTTSGIAVRVNNNRIYSLLRFSPQNKESFMLNIAPVVGIIETKPQPIDEPGL